MAAVRMAGTWTRDLSHILVDFSAAFTLVKRKFVKEGHVITWSYTNQLPFSVDSASFNLLDYFKFIFEFIIANSLQMYST